MMNKRDFPLPPNADMDSSQDAWLKITNVSKSFGEAKVLKDISLSVRKGEFVCLLGASGCGKTTLLRILAGLEQQDTGGIQMGENAIGNLPAAKRNYGIVFQSYALFPNLTVAQNVAYALRMDRNARAARVAELLNMVGLGGREKDYPAQLSGGQQQRVALARALATSPSLLLLDEPLSALDAKVREHLRQELSSLQRKLGITTIMVTHDQDEALALADRIAVMADGQIEQVGTPENIYRQPASRFVADFVGRANWLPVRIDENGRVLLGQHMLDVTLPAGPATATAFCRPEDVCVEPSWASDAGMVMTFVQRVDFAGGIRRALVSLCAAPDIEIQVDVGPHGSGYDQLEVGKRVPISLPGHSLRFFMDGAK